MHDAYSYNLSPIGCGDIFKDHNSSFIYAFAEHLMWDNFLLAKFYGVMRSIEIARDKGWSMLWVKLDSSLVIKAFVDSNSVLVPWQLRST